MDSLRWFCFLALVLSVACTSAPGVRPDAEVDSGLQNVILTPDPVGGGVCCPRSVSACIHSGGLHTGGWAARAEDCRPINVYDGVWQETVDQHGCTFWRDVYGWSTTGDVVCCGCRVDAGGP